MTENTVNVGKTDAGSESALIDLDLPDELAEPTADDDALPAEPAEIDADADDDDLGEDSVPVSGAVSGGFGFAGLALAVVSLTTNWTSGVVVSHDQYSVQVRETSSPTVQQQLDMFASGWHTQAWWAFVFAAAAVVFGAGALLVPALWGRAPAPGWARAGATSAVIVGLVGVLLAVLTLTGVFGGHITAPVTGS